MCDLQGMKTCIRCHTLKNERDFNRSQQSRDGLLGSCKECIQARRRQQYDAAAKKDYYQRNRSSIREKQADHYLDHQSERQVKSKEWYVEQHEVILQKKKVWYHQNLETARARNKARYQKSRERIIALKEGRPCVDCHRVFPPCCMDFDHLPENGKSCNVSQLSKMEELLKEADKCELVCKVCHRIRTVKRRPLRRMMNPAVEARLEFLKEVKSQPCLNCGLTYPPEAMDLHHRDPSGKLSEIGMLVRKASLTRLKKEVAKCDILCANCHALLHFG